MDENLIYLSNKIEEQYGAELKNEVFEGYESIKKVTFRVNKIKSSNEEMEKILNENKISFEKVSWYDSAFILNDVSEQEIENLDIYKDGKIYMQSLSSMLPPIILNPKAEMDILDMCAAPGGKTTQIAALTENYAHITACEMNPIRLQKLKYNIEKQGARGVNIMKKDARDLDDFFAFDSILLDAPCSGSGTIVLNDEKTYKYFSNNLVNKSVKAQKKLLRKAIKLLKKGKEMVYSTCSILQEENENIINEILSEGNVEIVKEYIPNVPQLPCKIDGAICVKPTEIYEGFFVVKLRKK